mgnify:CR=1 FL=1
MLFRSYEGLLEYKREQNRGSVRDIPAKLARIGCVMVPESAGAPSTALSAEEIELLARTEHERWMQGLGPGWRHGSPTDKDRKIHEDYLPWEQLRPEEQEKDRNLVREIPTILHEAGYALVRTGTSGSTET